MEGKPCASSSGVCVIHWELVPRATTHAGWACTDTHLDVDVGVLVLRAIHLGNGHCTGNKVSSESPLVRPVAERSCHNTSAPVSTLANRLASFL